jgi:hypothetical protein
LRSPHSTLPAEITVPTFPQRSPPRLLTAAARGGLGSAPDLRTRRALLHLSNSCASPYGPAMLVTHDPLRTSRVHRSTSERAVREGTTHLLETGGSGNRNARSALDHLVGGRQQRFRDGEAEGLGISAIGRGARSAALVLAFWFHFGNSLTCLGRVFFSSRPLHPSGFHLPHFLDRPFTLRGGRLSRSGSAGLDLQKDSLRRHFPGQSDIMPSKAVDPRLGHHKASGLSTNS